MTVCKRKCSEILFIHMIGVKLKAGGKNGPGKTSPNVGGNKKINASCLGWVVKKKPLICKLFKTNHPLLWPAHFLKICNLPQIRSNRNISLQFKSWNQPKVESVNADLACLVSGLWADLGLFGETEEQPMFSPTTTAAALDYHVIQVPTHCLWDHLFFGTHYHDKLCCFGTTVTFLTYKEIWGHSCCYCCSSFDAEQKQAHNSNCFLWSLHIIGFSW